MKNWGGGGPGGSGWGSQDGCERRIEVFVKIQKKNWRGVRGGGGRVGGGGGQGVCDRRIEKFLGKFTKKIQGGGCRFGGGGGSG